MALGEWLRQEDGEDRRKKRSVKLFIILWHYNDRIGGCREMGGGIRDGWGGVCGGGTSMGATKGRKRSGFEEKWEEIRGICDRMRKMKNVWLGRCFNGGE